MDFTTSFVAIWTTLIGVGAPVVMLGLWFWHKSRMARMAQETALRLAEKGQPVPPELFLNQQDPLSDLRRGVVLVGLGLGLGIYMAQLGKPWSVGLIPLLVGVGYLIVWKLESGKNDKPDIKSGDR